MATVQISVTTGQRDYSVRLDYDETNAEAWGRDKSHIDKVVAAAVADIQRAYTQPAPQ